MKNLETSLTTYLLTHNNESTIEDTLKSILWLESPIVIGDMSSKDKTIEICEKYNAKIFHVHFQDDYSKAKNELLDKTKSMWKLYLEPWESIITGHKNILSAIRNFNPSSHYFQILYQNTVTKDIRLWNKNLKFSNPIFENIIDKTATVLDVIINKKNNPSIPEKEIERLLNIWKQKDPLSEDPYYYQAYQLLALKKYEQFQLLAEKYIAFNRRGMASVMIRYYLAMVCLYSLNDKLKSIKYILECISVRPLMSEFWCLLGDVYYKDNKYEKAKSFYENAIILGKERLKDEWPVEIPKYKDYPKKMIESCQNIVNNSKTFGGL